MYVCINICIYNIYKAFVIPGSEHQIMTYYYTEFSLQCRLYSVSVSLLITRILGNALFHT
jgi:hypothetical protein